MPSTIVSVDDKISSDLKVVSLSDSHDGNKSHIELIGVGHPQIHEITEWNEKGRAGSIVGDGTHIMAPPVRRTDEYDVDFE